MMYKELIYFFQFSGNPSQGRDRVMTLGVDSLNWAGSDVFVGGESCVSDTHDTGLDPQTELHRTLCAFQPTGGGLMHS